MLPQDGTSLSEVRAEEEFWLPASERRPRRSMFSRERVAKRFWAKVDREGPVPAHAPELGPCWSWTGARSRDYGTFYLDGHDRKAHRVSYMLENGFLEDAVHLCHHCDNKGCVRPSHLYEGDPQTNGRDRALRPRNRPPLLPSEVLDLKQRHADGVSVQQLARDADLSTVHVENLVKGKARNPDGKKRVSSQRLGRAFKHSRRGHSGAVSP